MHQPIEPIRSFFTFDSDFRNSTAGVQIASRAVFRTAPMISWASVGAVATFPDRDQSPASRNPVGQLRGLLLDPIISPQYSWMTTAPEKAFTLGSVQDPLHGFIAALVGNSLAASGESGDGECKSREPGTQVSW